LEQIHEFAVVMIKIGKGFSRLICLIVSAGQSDAYGGGMMGGGWGMGYGMGGVGGIGVLLLGLVVVGIVVMALRRRSP
jgi:hypothetical protein